MVRNTIGALVAIAALVFGTQAQAVQDVNVTPAPAGSYVEGNALAVNPVVAAGSNCGCAAKTSEARFGTFHANCGRGISQYEAAALWTDYCNEDCSVNTSGHCGCGGACGVFGGFDSGYNDGCGDAGCNSCGCGGGGGCRSGKSLFGGHAARKASCGGRCAVQNDCAPCAARNRCSLFDRKGCDTCVDDCRCGKGCGHGLLARRAGGDCNPCGDCGCGGKHRGVFARKKSSHCQVCGSQQICGGSQNTNPQYANVGSGNSYFNYAVGQDYGKGQFSFYSNNASSVLNPTYGYSSPFWRASVDQNSNFNVNNYPAFAPGTTQPSWNNGANQTYGSGQFTGETSPASSPAQNYDSFGSPDGT